MAECQSLRASSPGLPFVTGHSSIGVETLRQERARVVWSLRPLFLTPAFALLWVLPSSREAEELVTELLGKGPGSLCPEQCVGTELCPGQGGGGYHPR